MVDDSPGIPETANLFVPFFTPKPRGTGTGVVLSRQIAEAHDRGRCETGSTLGERRPR